MRGQFRGSLVALPTPFRGGAIDFPSLLRLIERQIAAGTDGLVVAGTTGEAATLEPEERTAVIEYTLGVVRGRVPVVAGVGTNATAATCRLASAAESAGVDGVLVVTPYYNRPTQLGLLQHYTDVAHAVRCAVVLYNVPSRTAVDLLPETVGELAERCPNVAAIKEASSVERLRELLALDDIDVLCGDDAAIADGMQLGASGVIGVAGNVVPRRVGELVRAARPGADATHAAALVEELAPLFRALFLESNPAPLKHALAHLGLCGPELRRPLCRVTRETGARLEGVLEHLGVRP